MAKALYYPKANRTAQNFSGAFRGSLIDPDKLLWHTTETGGWPAYGGGATAPHLTYHAEIHQWRQHFPANRSARALRNEFGGVETNTDDVLQVEIIAYSDERLAAQRGHLAVSDLDSEALDDLADFSAWALREWGVPLRVDPGWVRSNYRNPRRMSNAQWRGFSGHTGHNRAPENSHFDPAALDIDEIIRRASDGEALPDTGGDDNMANLFETEAEFEAAVVAAVQRAVNASSMRDLDRTLTAEAVERLLNTSRIRELFRQQVDAATGDLNQQIATLTQEVRALRSQLGS